jgi:hypothetical protein
MKWPSQSPREHLSRPLTGNFTDYVGGDLGERRLAQRFPAVADTEEVTWGRTRGSVELQVSCPKPQVSATAMNPRHRSNRIGRAATRARCIQRLRHGELDQRAPGTPLRWPRQATHFDSERTSRTGKLSGKRGCRVFVTRQVRSRTRPDLRCCGGAPPESSRRPHPYNGSGAHRRATRRSRSSRDTVSAAVMGPLLASRVSAGPACCSEVASRPFSGSRAAPSSQVRSSAGSGQSPEVRSG